MSDSENEGEMKRLTNVDELKEILASFDAADIKTSARGVKESLRAARAVIEGILARPWEEPDEDDGLSPWMMRTRFLNICDAIENA